MALWREGGFAENIWTHVADEADVPRHGAAIVSFGRWRRERETLAGREGAVGVEIAAGAEALEHLRDAANRPLVALRFDKFADGRAFSYAILLRQRHGFSGELRAVGEVLIDEIPLMLRCGFDSFEVVNAPTLRALHEGGAPKFPLAYQPSAVLREGAAGHRPWARQVG